MKIRESLCFDDVLLVPQYSNIKSRKEVDLSYQLTNVSKTLTLPIISSPMDTVTGPTMACAMDEQGGLGIIHRYNTLDEQSEMVRRVVENKEGPINVGVAIGVSGDYIKRASNAIFHGVNVLCIDIAHGHHILMERALKSVRDKWGDNVHIMAGNVATRQAFSDLSDWGADSIRVGIGGGSICSTRVQTGHGVPTLDSIFDCAASDRDATIIADGGIRNSGDIVKALAAGADLVMLGSLLAGTNETPGEPFYDSKKNQYLKTYRGMASVEAQINWRGHASSIEGVATAVQQKGAVGLILENIKTGIRSGLSYSGVRNIGELQAGSKFIHQSPSGVLESGTHIF